MQEKKLTLHKQLHIIKRTRFYKYWLRIGQDFVLCDYQFLATPLEVFTKVPPCFLVKVYVPGFFFPICPIDSLLGLSLDFVQAKEG